LIPTLPDGSINTRALLSASPGPVNKIIRLSGDRFPISKSLPVVNRYASNGSPISSVREYVLELIPMRIYPPSSVPASAVAMKLVDADTPLLIFRIFTRYESSDEP